MNWLGLTLALLTVAQWLYAEECVSRDYDKGSTVCVCNSTYCDTISPIRKLENGHFIKVTTNKDGLRFQRETGNFSDANSNAKNVIEIGNETYQEILGFGGAFTDSTAVNIHSLDEDAQEKLLRSYFSDEGIEYNIGRVPIGGTDFSVEPYSYCDTEDPDPGLGNFSLRSEDYEGKIPLIKRAAALSNDSLVLYASAWTAPNWMKTRPGFEKSLSGIKNEYYQTWADYFVKFLDAYKENNITFWGITTGNEPFSGTFVTKGIPCVGWLPNHMVDWIRNHFVPTVKKAYPHIKLMTVDDQRALLPWLVQLLFLDEDVKNFIDGIAVHWYMDIITSPNLLTDTHNKYPDKFILGTEACNGYLTHAVPLGSWSNAETYANDIIKDLNHWMVGWTDWNMALDLTGGPTYIKNNVDAPIIVNATAGEFYKQPSFYSMGHFSKFIPKGSVRVEAPAFDDNVPVTAFRRPDGGTTVVILNKKSKEISTTIRDSTKGDIKLNLTAKSLTSIVYW